MEVVADLALELDGNRATVVASGTDIAVQCADPAALLEVLASAALPSAVGRLSGPRALGRAAAGLQEAGLLVTVAGPAGPILELGRGTHSLLGRVLTGSGAVRPGGWAAIRPLAAASAGRAVTRHPRGWTAVLAGVVGAAVVTRRLLRRPTDS